MQNIHKNKALIVVAKALLAAFAFSIPILAAQILSDSFVNRIIVAAVGLLVLYQALPDLVNIRGKRRSYWGIYSGSFVVMMIIFEIFSR